MKEPCQPGLALARPAGMATIHSFGGGRADGGRELRDRLGGKGANLAEMARLGLPVPPGFTIGTDVCATFRAGGALPADEIDRALAQLEALAGARFGDPANPLLLSVRSGAPNPRPSRR